MEIKVRAQCMELLAKVPGMIGVVTHGRLAFECKNEPKGYVDPYRGIYCPKLIKKLEEKRHGR